MASLPVKPSRRASAASRRRPSALRKSTNTVSRAATLAAAAAATHKLRARRNGPVKLPSLSRVGFAPLLAGGAAGGAPHKRRGGQTGRVRRPSLSGLFPAQLPAERSWAPRGGAEPTRD